MKVSLKWAQRYSNVDLLSIPVAELLQKIGAQLGAVEEVTVWGPRFDGIVVAKVVSCVKHPDADKLNVCMIDDGGVTKNVERDENGNVQVVCGAPNVREGLLVAWLPPGSTVPSSIDKDPFVLGARELRGVVSNGMLASSHELGLSDDHTGILEITDQIDPGTPFKNLFDLDDVVIDCENKMFTHRPDCFGILGVARELAGIMGQKFVSPSWYSTDKSHQSQVSSLQSSSSSSLPLVSSNEIPNKVPRFMAQVVENVIVKPSATTLQADLMRVGSRPINDIVDLTNYYMHLTAQPTHAFDYDKVKALCDAEVTILPRMAIDGETLDLLNGKTIILTENDIVIATGKHPIALAGVMGGSATEVDDNTKNIIVECANFDMYTIRRTSMRHGLFTDAVTRFNKGQSALQNPQVLAKLVDTIAEVSGGIPGVIIDSNPELSDDTLQSISTTLSFINDRLGSSLDAEQIKTLLENVEFDVTVNGSDLIIAAPFWRKDIEIAEDIVEEVGRLYGFDKLPVELPVRPISPVTKNMTLELKSNVRSMLAQAGANEILTYSFVSNKLLQSTGQDSKQAYQLGNALSPALEYYRLTLTPSVFSKVQQNIRAGFDSFALFEFSKTHVRMHGKDESGLPKELPMLALTYAVNDKCVGKGKGAAFYTARKYLDYLGAGLGTTFEYKALESDLGYEVTKPYDWKRSALVTDISTGTFVGIVGEYTQLTRKNFKLPKHSAGFEIDYDALLQISVNNASYRALSRFPGITQDMTFKVPADQPFVVLQSIMETQVSSLSKAHGYIARLTPLGIYQKEDNVDKQITFRLTVNHPDRTLKTDEINTLVYEIAEFAQLNANAVKI